MALTIRKLSDTAESTLLKIMEKNEDINTNTKAIEFVLENYLIKCGLLEDEENRTRNLKRELWEAQGKLETISKGFGLIQEMISKK